jgi:hypothetical protein
MLHLAQTLRFSFSICLLTAVLAFPLPATAQPLSPDTSETCKPADVTSLLNPDSGEKAACERRTYTLPATGTFSLAQNNYEDIKVSAWDRDAVEVEMVVVARRNSTVEDARADVQQVRLTDEDGTLRPTGPAGDTPGWWSASYEIHVPAQTTLDITSDNADITAYNVAGAHVLTSKNGDVSYTFPKDADAELRITTKYGVIDLGFPVMVEGSIGKRLETTIGDGGPTVQLTSKNGDIRVDRTE